MHLWQIHDILSCTSGNTKIMIALVYEVNGGVTDDGLRMSICNQT
jgi:hypothetical protein